MLMNYQSIIVILLCDIQKVAIMNKLFSNFECDFHSYHFLCETNNRSAEVMDIVINSLVHKVGLRVIF